MNNENVDVLVIGAGPSGAVAAAYLHKEGVKVKVVEKSKFPRFSIGESLLPRCMDHFEEVGLLDCIKARGYEKKYGARFIRGKSICLFDFSRKFTPGWDWTWQVPRADFDHTIAKELIKMGIDVAFEYEVTDVQFDGTKSLTTLKDKEGRPSTVNANFIVDSSGFGRVLPRLLDLDKPSELPKNSSIFTHVVDSKRPEGREGTLISFDIVKDKVWLWVIPFSNGITSIGVVGPTEFIDTYGNDTDAALKEMLKLSDYYYSRFEGLDFLFTPYKFKNLAMAVKQTYGDGFVLTGNSAEFLDPVFSSGVTFATESALCASKLICKQLRNECVDWEKDYKGYMKKGVDVFATYVKEWYNGNLPKLFFHEPENPDIKQKICAVLAGYVWDESNPFVTKHHRLVNSIAHLIDLEVGEK